jgi:hypothetical protein
MVGSNSDTQATKNLRLSVALVRAIVAQPTLLRDIPRGANVVLLPAGDRALLEDNLELAIASARQGEDVFLMHWPRRVPAPDDAPVPAARRRRDPMSH